MQINDPQLPPELLCLQIWLLAFPKPELDHILSFVVQLPEDEEQNHGMEIQHQL